MVSPPVSPTNTTASVQVVVRLRPLNDKEKKNSTLPVVSASTSDRTVTVLKGTGSRQVKTCYKFDNVFTAFSTQEDVFEATLKPVIHDVLNGYESTVFAYGQTGTGKVRR
jgi:kinesin family protein 11